MGGGGLEVGVCDTVSQCPASLRIPHCPVFVLSPVHQGEDSGGGDSGSLPQGCGRTCTSFSGVLQSHVRGHQGVGKVETYHRSLHPEPVGGEDTVSDGDCSVSSLLGAEERLDGLHRPEGCLPSGPNSPTEFKVPQVHSQREGLAVQGPLLWSLHGATGVQSDHGSCVWFPPPVRRSDFEISGLILASSREEVCWAREKS